jgi:hypothetical protein
VFAIGVFVGFTLSQAGMVRHWRADRQPGWAGRAAINGLGAVLTLAALAVELVSKFTEGAWLVVLIVPLLVLMFSRVHATYHRIGSLLQIGTLPPHPAGRSALVVVPVGGISRLTEEGISAALSLGDEVVAVTVSYVDEDGPPDAGPGPESGGAGSTGAGGAGAGGAGAGGAGAGGQTGGGGDEHRIPVDPGQALHDLWDRWDPGVPLVTLHAKHRSLGPPIVHYLRDLEAQDRFHRIVVLIPEVQPIRPWQQILHNQRGFVLDRAIRKGTENVVICRLRFQRSTWSDSDS